MKTIILVFFLNILSISLSCSTSEKEINYQKFKDNVSPIVFESFPIEKKDVKDCTAQIIKFPDAFEYVKYSNLVVIYENLSENDFNEKVKYIEKNKLAVYSAGDICNKYIPIKKDEKKINCESSYLPVPSISNGFNKLYKYVSSENSKIYVLKTGMDRDLLTAHKGISKEFTNGAIIDYKNNTILYWILII